MKNVAAATRKMIEFYHGNRHDIAHFLKVWALAKTIGELEGLDGHTQEALELEHADMLRFFVPKTGPAL